MILEGIHYRFQAGDTVGEGFDRIGALVEPLAAEDGLRGALMDFAPDDRTRELTERARAFLDEHVLPAEPVLDGAARRDARRVGRAADRARAAGEGARGRGCGTSSSPARRARG